MSSASRETADRILYVRRHGLSEKKPLTKVLLIGVGPQWPAGDEALIDSRRDLDGAHPGGNSSWIPPYSFPSRRPVRRGGGAHTVGRSSGIVSLRISFYLCENTRLAVCYLMGDRHRGAAELGEWSFGRTPKDHSSIKRPPEILGRGGLEYGRHQVRVAPICQADRLGGHRTRDPTGSDWRRSTAWPIAVSGRPGRRYPDWVINLLCLAVQL